MIPSLYRCDQLPWICFDIPIATDNFAIVPMRHECFILGGVSIPQYAKFLCALLGVSTMVTCEQ